MRRPIKSKRSLEDQGTQSSILGQPLSVERFEKDTLVGRGAYGGGIQRGRVYANF